METSRNADSPFDPASHTPDIILRSSDNVDFYVMKTFLAFSSPDVFAAMFTLPQTEHDIPSPSGLPIVPLTEDSKALRILLLYCYPLDSHGQANDLGDITRALFAARKYAMDFTEKRIEKILISKARSQLNDNPLHIYALACRCGLEELGREAAKKTFEFPLSHLLPSPELKHITAMDLYQLLQLRRRCIDSIWKWYFSEADHYVQDRFVPEPEAYIWLGKSHTAGQRCYVEITELQRQDDLTYYFRGDAPFHVEATEWWTTYFVALMKAIELRPSKRTVFHFSDNAYYGALAAASCCTFCSRDAGRHLDHFREHFAWNVDKIVTKELTALKFESSSG